MDNLAWLGFLLSAALGVWAGRDLDLGKAMASVHGPSLVLGGVACAMLVNYPVHQIRRALGWVFKVLFPPRLPSPNEVAEEVLRLAALAKDQGGLLALQNESPDFAGGFLNRALLVAVAAGEAQKVREILEAEIVQDRLNAQEDSNFFRTMGTLAPMFGLLGTLFGIILVLRNIADPLKVGPAMAIAITSSLYGISFANVICIPIAGRIRAQYLMQSRVREIIVQGVLDLMRQESVYLLELRLKPYLEAPKEAPAAPQEAVT